MASFDTSSMTPEEEEQALRMARIAKLAEQKARGDKQPMDLTERLKQAKEAAQPTHVAHSVRKEDDLLAKKKTGPKFLTKADREKAALERLKNKRAGNPTSGAPSSRDSHESRRDDDDRPPAKRRMTNDQDVRRRESSSAAANRPKDKELQLIREQYLGKKVQRKKVVKPSEKFAKIFQFDWESTDDTTEDLNPIYASRMSINPLFGRGYFAGTDLQQQRKGNQFNQTLVEKRQEEERRREMTDRSLSKSEIRDRERARQKAIADIQRLEQDRDAQLEKRSIGLKSKHWSDKALGEMNERDWRIFREDYDIVVRGGRAPLPLRSWEESTIPAPIMEAIHALKYKDPSPIQRQAIPIGLEARDIIGIAETGSGKTCAFTVPMLAYIMNQPENRRERLADEGPLAMVLAPTRELAQQIEVEVQRLSKNLRYRTVSVVGGQSIQDQGFHLREGVEVVIGTPGRLKDALESRYLVLNQCNYIVMDEADRMIDMGFEEDLNFVLDSMGTLLKSEAEEEAYRQEELAKKGELLFRVTCMFSATMPPEVEHIAKQYLRHPAIVSIGDQDSGKNKRITQVVHMVTEGQKAQRVVQEARPKTAEDKVIVFVNEKKRCDMVARNFEKAGVRCTILHGGKTQDQREQSLELFRTGAIQVLVATDVAGRGLDIPDVSLVLNYDMAKAIEPYCHRIGRTGRAGKHGAAVTFLTEADEEVFYDLKEYLTNTDSDVPSQLARHPAASAPPGTVDQRGRPATSRRDTVIFAK